MPAFGQKQTLVQKLKTLKEGRLRFLHWGQTGLKG